MNELFRTIEQFEKAISESIINTPPQILVPMKALFSTYPNNAGDIQIIFNDPATILIIGDRKYVSKAHGEGFDEEKGLLMCLAKANGFSHSKLKALMKSAKRHKNNN